MTKTNQHEPIKRHNLSRLTNNDKTSEGRKTNNQKSRTRLDTTQ